ncbi:MAG: trypsin-like peptidase domain-containing protein [Clostridia bacterium]|nr:trypsin-like peptidase domain-containing protein [Clostridia bacterium]
MRFRKILGLVVSVLLVFWSVDVLAYADVSSFDHDAIMSDVINGKYGLDDLNDLMLLDETLCIDILSWLDEVSTPIRDVESDYDMVSRQADYYGRWVVDRPDLSGNSKYICKVFMQSDKGGFFSGSGMLIGHSAFMTAAHCAFEPVDVYSEDGKSVVWSGKTYATSMMVVPSLYYTNVELEEYPDDYEGEKIFYATQTYPLGWAYCDIDKGYVNEDWRSLNHSYRIADVKYDWAVFPLRSKTSNFLDNGFWNLRTMDDSSDAGDCGVVNSFGYPAFSYDNAADGIINLTCNRAPSWKSFMYGTNLIDCAILGGMSGGPVFDSTGHVVAVNSGVFDSDENKGAVCNITSRILYVLHEYCDGAYYDRELGEWQPYGTP